MRRSLRPGRDGRVESGLGQAITRPSGKLSSCADERQPVEDRDRGDLTSVRIFLPQLRDRQLEPSEEIVEAFGPPMVTVEGTRKLERERKERNSRDFAQLEPGEGAAMPDAAGR